MSMGSDGQLRPSLPLTGRGPGGADTWSLTALSEEGVRVQGDPCGCAGHRPSSA